MVESSSKTRCQNLIVISFFPFSANSANFTEVCHCALEETLAVSQLGSDWQKNDFGFIPSRPINASGILKLLTTTSLPIFLPYVAIQLGISIATPLSTINSQKENLIHPHWYCMLLGVIVPTLWLMVYYNIKNFI